MPSCPDCEKEFDSEKGLNIHIGVEHETGTDDIGDLFLDVWKTPQAAFLIGILIGVVLVGLLLLSPTTAFQPQNADDIGSAVLHHYQSQAPAAVGYELVDTKPTGFGMYAVTLRVVRGSLESTETVYVTADGKQVFETPPRRVQFKFAALTDE